MEENVEKKKLIEKLQRDIDRINNDILDHEFLRQEHLDDIKDLDARDDEYHLKIEELKAVIAILEKE